MNRWMKNKTLVGFFILCIVTKLDKLEQAKVTYQENQLQRQPIQAGHSNTILPAYGRKKQKEKVKP